MTPRIARAAIFCGLMLCSATVCLAQRAADVVSPALLHAPASDAGANAKDQRSGIPLDSVGHHPSDTFLGPDKVKHFMMSAFVESIGFSALQAVGADRSASIAAATAVTVATGIGREIHDGRTKGLFSFGDLTWDAVGLGAALILISHTQR